MPSLAPMRHRHRGARVALTAADAAAGLVLDRSKRYGDTTLWWASFDEVDEVDEAP